MFVIIQGPSVLAPKQVTQKEGQNSVKLKDDKNTIGLKKA